MHALDGLHVHWRHTVANPLVTHHSRLRAFSNALVHKGSPRCPRHRKQLTVRLAQTDTDYRSVIPF